MTTQPAGNPQWPIQNNVRVWMGIITQNGTDAPVIQATIMNTIGIQGWTRVSQGLYRLSLDEPYTQILGWTQGDNANKYLIAAKNEPSQFHILQTLISDQSVVDGLNPTAVWVFAVR